MKKIFLLLLAVLTMSNMYSCLDNETTTNLISSGMEIYNTGKLQANLDMDPILVAMKLNTLIVTADSLGEDYKTVEVVIVEAQEADDDDEEVEEERVVVIEQLFGTNNVTNSGTRWTIGYTVEEIIDKELPYRIGTFVIETNGFKLEDLEEAGSMWEISFDGGNYDLYYSGYSDRFVNDFDYYYIEPGDEGRYSWKISGTSRAFFGSNSLYPASVDFSYEVKSTGSFFYKDILSSAFYLSGTSEGRFAGFYGNGYSATYEAASLKFKPACTLYNTYGGSEKVTILRSEIPVEEYPDNTVKYNWFDATATTECGYTVDVGYNGYVVSY